MAEVVLCTFAALGLYGWRWQNGLLSAAAFVLSYAFYIAFIMAVGIAGVIVFIVRNSTG